MRDQLEVVYLYFLFRYYHFLVLHYGCAGRVDDSTRCDYGFSNRVQEIYYLPSIIKSRRVIGEMRRPNLRVQMYFMVGDGRPISNAKYLARKSFLRPRIL